MSASVVGARHETEVNMTEIEDLHYCGRCGTEFEEFEAPELNQPEGGALREVEEELGLESNPTLCRPCLEQVFRLAHEKAASQ